MPYQDRRTLTTMYQEVSDNIGLGASPGTTDRNRIINRLNDVQKVICRRHPWSALVREDSSFITRAGKYRYVLPPFISKILSARLIDDSCCVLDECERGWVLGTPASIAYDTTYVMEGKSSLKITETTADPSGVMAYKLLSAKIAGYAAAASTNNTLITTTGHTLVSGDRITINNSTNYNGTFEVISAVTDYITINKTYTAETVDITDYPYWSLATRDVSGWNKAAVGFWIYSDTAIAAGTLAAGLSVVISAAVNGSKTGTQGTDYEVFHVTQAIPAYRWTYVRTGPADLGSLDDLTSVSIFAESDFNSSTAINIYIDGLNLYSLEYGGSNWPLKTLTTKKMDHSAPNPQYLSQNRPIALLVSGADDHSVRELQFYPVPDDFYPVWIRYIAWPTAFTTDSLNAYCDIPDIDDLLVAGATWVELARTRSWESSNRWFTIFNKLLVDAFENDEEIDGWEMELEGFSGGGGMSLGDLLEVPSNTQGGVRGSSSGFFYIG